MSDTLLIHNRSSSLFPKGNYSKELKKDLFSHGRQKDLADKLVIFEDTVSDTIINLWSLEKKDLDKLKENYRFSNLTHSSTLFIKACLSKTTDGIFYNKLSTGIEVLVINKAGIQLYNSLFGSKSEDLLYYVLLYKDRYGSGLPVYVSARFGLDSMNLLSTYLKGIKEISFPATTKVYTGSSDFNVLKCV